MRSVSEQLVLADAEVATSTSQQNRNCCDDSGNETHIGQDHEPHAIMMVNAPAAFHRNAATATTHRFHRIGRPMSFRVSREGD